MKTVPYIKHIPLKKHALLSLFFLLFFNVSSLCQAQNNIVRGKITDAQTGEDLIGASVYHPQTKRGVISNSYGYFSISTPQEGEITLVVSFLGYQSREISIDNLSKTEPLVIELSPSQVDLEEIELVGEHYIPINERNEIGTIRLKAAQIEHLPSLGGEVDLFKALQLLPGVHSGNEGGSGLYVRGGSPDQNLILLDDVPLYYVNHLGGFVSIFNNDAINSVELRKGGIPARFGGRLSSAIDIRLKEGNKKEFKGKGLIGLIASKIAIEGPIKKDTTSYIVSVRRLLYDLISRPLTKIATDGISIGYSFHDINAKINHLVDEKNHLYFSAYLGQDRSVLNIKEAGKIKNSVQWGNNLLALRWNHLFNERLMSNTTLAYTRYRFLNRTKADLNDGLDKSTSNSQFLSGIYDFSGKYELDYFLSNTHQIKFGVNSTHHQYRPGISTYKSSENAQNTFNEKVGNPDLTAWEHAVYIENEFKIGEIISGNLGLRTVLFNVQNQNYTSIEPRGLIGIKLNANTKLKTAYTQIQQNIHLLTSSGIGLPIDLWVPPTAKVAPQKVKQWSAGIAHLTSSKKYEISLEAYSKDFKNLISYKEGSSFIGNTSDWESLVEVGGTGKAYGLEFLVEKKQGRTAGWLAYTLSKAERTFANINQGKTFPFRYDRRHNLSLFASHKLNERVHLSATWVYSTGLRYTLAIGKFDLIEENIESERNETTEVYIYGDRNNQKLRDYHRLDLGINFSKEKKWGKRTWNISIYNAYNRQNAYFNYIESENIYANNGFEEIRRETRLKQQSLFPIIPSVSYAFEF